MSTDIKLEILKHFLCTTTTIAPLPVEGNMRERHSHLGDTAHRKGEETEKGGRDGTYEAKLAVRKQID